MPTSETTARKTVARERVDLLETLAKHRDFLRLTVRNLTDQQAAQRSTISQLCLGGLLKHVADVESSWTDFILGGADAMAQGTAGWDTTLWLSRFELLPGESLAGLLEHYDEVAERTDEIVATLPDLDHAHRLPEAPWFEKDAHWSARRVLLHIIAETAQHAGHADIIREAIDRIQDHGVGAASTPTHTPTTGAPPSCGTIPYRI